MILAGIGLAIMIGWPFSIAMIALGRILPCPGEGTPQHAAFGCKRCRRQQ